MSQAQILSLLRQIITFASAYLIGAGYLTNEQAGALGEIILGLVPVASFAWALWASRKAGIVNAAAAIPNVTGIQVTTQSFSDKIPSEKVTTS